MSLLRLIPLNLRTLSQLLLALMLLVSSLVWLPPAAQAAPQQEASAAVQMQAWIQGSRVYLEAVQLPRVRTFNFRIRRRSTGDWTRLTMVRSNRRGELATSARLPSNLRSATRLQVCLKDWQTSRLYCTWARRRY